MSPKILASAALAAAAIALMGGGVQAETQAGEKPNIAVNRFRCFKGRVTCPWGAHRTSSDPEWKYVNLRRYFVYLEHSIDKATQWAGFEPNSEPLWANVRRTIEDFLQNEWQRGALLGDSPEKAYFVKCDRSTMSQNDVDNGRLVCLVGIAPVRPAEFVIFRISQWTADRKTKLHRARRPIRFAN